MSMGIALLQFAIEQAVHDGLGRFLNQTGVVRFGGGPPSMVAERPDGLTPETPAMHGGPNMGRFYVLIDDSTRAMWTKACR